MPLPSGGASNFFAQYYYTKTELNAGQLDTLYFGEDEFINTSAGAGDAGKPIKLDASGLIPSSMLSGGTVATHAALTAAHGATGAVVGTTNTQTLTNKTLSSPVITTQAIVPLLYGDTAGNGDITIRGTSSATKTSSYVILQDTGGNVGVGTDTPAYDLDVSRSTAGAVGIGLSNPSDNSAAYATVVISGGTTNSSTGQLQVFGKDYTTAVVAGRVVLNANSNANGVSIRAASTGQTIDFYAGNATKRAEITSSGLDVTGTITQSTVPVVTTTGTQTLTNKTLTSPTLNGTVTLPLSNFYITSSASNPIVAFDSNDYMEYNRGTDTFRLYIGSNNRFEVRDAGTFVTNLNATGAITINSVAVPTISSADTLTNKTLTSPTINTPTIGTSMVVPLINGSTAANGDIAIHGTSSGTKATSYVQLQPSGGDVVVGGTTTDFNFEVQDAASNYRVTFNLNDSSENVIGSINDTVGSFTPAQLRLFSSRLRVDGVLNLVTTATPASAGATGTTGDIAWDTSYLYICTGSNQWRRVSHASW